jgi:hypothetical protein
VSKAPFRLAFRQEGKSWNAYMARPDTMDGAVLIGSIAMSLALHEPIKIAFMDVMKLAIGQAVTDVLGKPIESWHEPTQAPANERAGNG